MSTKSSEATALLADLVRTPSPSGDEVAAAALLADWAVSAGLDPSVDDAAVRIEVAGAASGPTLLLASHLDTVPVGDGWRRDPYGAEIADGYLHGRIPALLPDLFPDLSAYSVFIAGKPDFVEDCVAAVRALGAPENRIHTEGYFAHMQPERPDAARIAPV